MTADVSAAALAEIDDPEVIQELLEADHLDIATADATAETTTPTSSLTDRYDDFLSRRTDRSPATRTQYKRTIPHFIKYVAQRRCLTTADLSETLVDDYVDHLQDEFDNDATIVTYTKNVRTWLNWLNKRNQCPEDIYQLLDKDDLGLSPNARDVAIPTSVAETVLQQLRRQRRGTGKHAVFELAWNCGPRIGGLHALDVRDFDPDEAAIEFQHRPESGTRLKNGDETDGKDGDGERAAAIKDDVVDAIQLYLDNHHPMVRDDYGRMPLFGTSQGRAATSTLRRWIYSATSCRWTPETDCENDCDGSCDPDTAVCPYSYYPHAIRRGAIVDHLGGGLRQDRASERFDVSVKLLKTVYDPRTERDRLNDRRDAVEAAWD